MSVLARKKKTNKETKLGEKTFTIGNDVMTRSDRSQGQRFPYINFFSAKQFELSKVAKDNQILRTSKVNNCMIFTNCSAQNR